MNGYASLVVLSYHRPQLLMQGLDSLRQHTTYPYELIIVDDGSRDACWTFLMQELRQNRISTLIVNGGGNLGVGEGIYRGFEIATGDYLVKLDADLGYKPGWLEAGIKILQSDPSVKCAGWYDYLNYDPHDVGDDGKPRFNKLAQATAGAQGYAYVDDFVSSAFIIARQTYEEFGPLERGSAAFAEDVMFKRKLQAAGYRLAITVPDLLLNQGFGIGKSELVRLGQDGRPVVTSIHREPLIFGR